MKNKTYYLLIGFLIVGGGVLIIAATGNWRTRNAKRESAPDSVTLRQKKHVEEIPPGYVKYGGVIRPKHDVVASKKRNKQAPRRKPLIAVGTIPSLKKNKNVYTRSVTEAIESRSRKLAYRLTPFVAAPKFDRKAYAANPEKYLNEIAPGRIHDVLPASRKTAATRRVGKYRHQVVQGEIVILKAKTDPEMPVTFYSNRFGSFNGGVSTITIAANRDGIARVEFKTTSGMYGEVDILAASPVRSGRARYLVDIVLPKTR